MVQLWPPTLSVNQITLPIYVITCGITIWDTTHHQNPYIPRRYLQTLCFRPYVYHDKTIIGNTRLLIWQEGCMWSACLVATRGCVYLRIVVTSVVLGLLLMRKIIPWGAWGQSKMRWQTNNASESTQPEHLKISREWRSYATGVFITSQITAWVTKT